MQPEALRDLYHRLRRAITRRPALAQGSGKARVGMLEGLGCEVSEGTWRTLVDRHPDQGGGGRGPDPEHLMRASLGACVAMGYRLWGARLSVDVRDVAVDVICDYDVRGQLDLSPRVAVGWQRLVFDVRIVSSAGEAEVRRLVEVSDRLSPMLACLSPAITRVHHLQVIAPAPSPAGRERDVPSQVTPPDVKGNHGPPADAEG